MKYANDSFAKICLQKSKYNILNYSYYGRYFFNSLARYTMIQRELGVKALETQANIASDSVSAKKDISWVILETIIASWII